MFLINILLKDNINFKGVIGKFDKLYMKKVLLLKIAEVHKNHLTTVTNAF